MLDIRIETEKLSELLQQVMELPGIFSRARASALKSLGWHVQQDLKHEGRQATKGGLLQWPKLNPHTGVLAGRRTRDGKIRNRRWKRDRYRTGEKKGQTMQKFSKREEPFSRMVNMVRYNVDVEDDMVEIGFLNPKRNVYIWLRQHEKGYNVRITPKMRKMLFAWGFPVAADTTELKVPARPWVKPVERVWKDKATTVFERRFWVAYEKYRRSAKIGTRRR